jgi:hypothetical protein
VLEKDVEDGFDRSCEKLEVLYRVKEERNILHSVKRREANWTGHILRRKCLLKQVIKGSTWERIKVMRRQEVDLRSCLITLREGEDNDN